MAARALQSLESVKSAFNWRSSTLAYGEAASAPVELTFGTARSARQRGPRDIDFRDEAAFS